MHAKQLIGGRGAGNPAGMPLLIALDPGKQNVSGHQRRIVCPQSQRIRQECAVLLPGTLHCRPGGVADADIPSKRTDVQVLGFVVENRAIDVALAGRVHGEVAQAVGAGRCRDLLQLIACNTRHPGQFEQARFIARRQEKARKFAPLVAADKRRTGEQCARGDQLDLVAVEAAPDFTDRLLGQAGQHDALSFSLGIDEESKRPAGDDRATDEHEGSDTQGAQQRSAVDAQFLPGPAQVSDSRLVDSFQYSKQASCGQRGVSLLRALPHESVSAVVDPSQAA